MAIEVINTIWTAVGPAGVRWCQLYVSKNKAHTVYIQTNIPSTNSSSKIKGMSNGLWNIWVLRLNLPYVLTSDTRERQKKIWGHNDKPQKLPSQSTEGAE